MAKPPETPPNSDIEGVHRDGTGESRPLPPHGQGTGDLARADQESAARPDYAGGSAGDDRTG